MPAFLSSVRYLQFQWAKPHLDMSDRSNVIIISGHTLALQRYLEVDTASQWRIRSPWSVEIKVSKHEMKEGSLDSEDEG